MTGQEAPRSLVVVRHGRTAANAGGLLQGRRDLPLDDVGLTQAAAVAQVVADGRFGPVTAVVSSPLRRAVQTAEATASLLGLEVVVDARLIELDYGDLEGAPVGSVPAETWDAWRSDVEFCPPGGESLATLGRRTRAACEHWAIEPGGGAVVLVSHVSPIKAAVAWALGVDDGVAWRAHLDTASISRVILRGGRPMLSLFNETAHLG